MKKLFYVIAATALTGTMVFGNVTTAFAHGMQGGPQAPSEMTAPEDAPELPEGEAPALTDELPELPTMEDGELPELPTMEDGERPELPTLEDGELPAKPEGEDFVSPDGTPLEDAPELPEGEEPQLTGERPELPTLENGELPELPTLEDGELPAKPEGEDFVSPDGTPLEDAPELPEGEEPQLTGERPELPTLEDGELPELPTLEDGERPELPTLEDGELPELPEDAEEESENGFFGFFRNIGKAIANFFSNL
ncbi:MAG: hypothetical protein K6C69_02190 [Lachnospiraceae bacterium]|nr:hypothetical protein [Lachnospiraceae bacterium]